MATAARATATATPSPEAKASRMSSGRAAFFGFGFGFCFGVFHARDSRPGWAAQPGAAAGKAPNNSWQSVTPPLAVARLRL
jgi:hypothetical protein